eukprot:2449146-Pyramimonas_sp.AAC.1
MPQAMRSSTPWWVSDAQSPTSHVSEDVAGESFLFEKQRRKTTPPTSPSSEDVSGETLLHAMLDIRRPISNI